MFTIAMFTFGPLSENTFVLHNAARQCIIIDPGCYFDNERGELTDYISENGLQPKYLLNTHCHFDHVFGNRFVHDTWGLTPWLHPAEQPVLQNARQAGLKWNIPFDDYYEGPLQFLRENDTIELGADALKVLFAPGHSPGHVVFYCAAQHFVIGGDVLFREGVGRTDLPGQDFDTLRHSILTTMYALPDETVVCPGHGGTTTIGFEKANNPFVRVDS